MKAANGFIHWLLKGGAPAIVARTARVPSGRPSPRVVKRGNHYAILDERGRPVGRIVAPREFPRLGRNQGTFYLRQGR